MTERIKAILDAVTDRVLAYRPADKGQQAKKVARRMKRQRKKEARNADGDPLSCLACGRTGGVAEGEFFHEECPPK